MEKDIQYSMTHSVRVLMPIIPRREKWRFGALIVLSALTAIMELALAGLVALLAAIFASPEAALHNNPLRWLRENGGVDFGNDPRFTALAVLCALSVLILVKHVCNLVQQWHMAALSENISAAAKGHMFRFFQRAPFLWILRTGVAELNFGLDAAMRLAEVCISILQAFSLALILVALIVGLVGVSPLPTLLFFTGLALCGALIVKITRKVLDRRSREVYTANYHTSRLSHLALHGLKEIRFTRRENFLFGIYTEQLRTFARAATRQLAVARLPAASLEILGFGILVAVMLHLICVQGVGMARIAGLMGFMAAAAWRGLPVANRMLDYLATLRIRLPYLHKVAEFLVLERSLTVELLPLDTEPATLRFERCITLENISFRYPGASTAAVRKLSMHIDAGAMIGLVGLSGSGKSTLVHLLTGLVPPESGRMLVDGVPVDKANAAAWLGCIGYVAQSPYILDASLAENVALSRLGESIDRKKVLACCRMAAMDFLDALEDGLDTILGERGARLSGGQIQRVAIARALYGDPALIIFDEATSSLDMKNEKAIHETILSLRDKMTIVLVAHRLSTLEGCDVVVWLDRGTIRQSGAAEHVLASYREALEAVADVEVNASG